MIHHRCIIYRIVVPVALLLSGLCMRAEGQDDDEVVSRPIAPIHLDVDATAVSSRLLHAHLTIPVNPGPVTLYYPKWIPGEHSPTGPIVNLSGLKLSVEGKPVAWQRDDIDMFTFHCTAPVGAHALDVDLDFLAPTENQGFSSAASTTANLAVISWNQLLLYPAGRAATNWTYQASLRLPEGWKFGTALPIEDNSAGSIRFKPVSLVTLINSPVQAGKYFKAVPLATGHEIDMVSDSEAALEMPEPTIASYKRLVAETGALFGARHYAHYNFLLTLSDHVASFGLEHHESSDDRVPERSLLDETSRKLMADLLPHEFFHSWNGKYRRPDGLATPDYQMPMKGGLLWVYEGLTDYYGNVLATRTGLWSASDYRDYLADIAAYLDNEPGRTWRPLADTAVAAQVLYAAPGDASSSRRGVDFYPEGDLIWLETDVMLRKQTGGKASLNDFCRHFHGGRDSEPMVRPYSFNDVVAALNDIAPYDWRTFLTDRLNSTSPHAPLGGIEKGGWRLTYTEEPSEHTRATEAEEKMIDCHYSLGLALKEDGTVQDVLAGSPAAQAGMGPGMKLVAINSLKWSADRLHEAIKAGKNQSSATDLLIEDGETYRTFHISYHGGERYPHLVRNETQPDLLSEILKPLAPATAAKP